MVVLPLTLAYTAAVCVILRVRVRDSDDSGTRLECRGCARPCGVNPGRRIGRRSGLGIARDAADAPSWRVRRIAALGGDRDHGVVALEAERDDAVHLITIHNASPRVPGGTPAHGIVAARPDEPSTGPLSAPTDLARLPMRPEDHAEKRCLWFVAMSRAQDQLTISAMVARFAHKWRLRLNRTSGQRESI